jgi:hypothetical protein
MTLDRSPTAPHNALPALSCLVNGDTVNKNATTNDNSVVSEITERGLQNGRSFGRGAYGNS